MWKYDNVAIYFTICDNIIFQVAQTHYTLNQLNQVTYSLQWDMLNCFQILNIKFKYHLNRSIIPIHYLSIFIIIKGIRLKQQTQILNDLNVFIFFHILDDIYLLPVSWCILDVQEIIHFNKISQSLMFWAMRQSLLSCLGFHVLAVELCKNQIWCCGCMHTITMKSYKKSSSTQWYAEAKNNVMR